VNSERKEKKRKIAGVGLTERQKEKETERQKEKETERQKEKETERQKEKDWSEREGREKGGGG